MPKRRIALIAQSLACGGTAKQVALLAAGLPRDEFDVHVVALARGGCCEFMLHRADVPYTTIGQRGWLDPGGCRRLITALRRLRPDVVHTWGAAANLCGRAAALAAGTKTIISGERCVDPLRSGASWALGRWLARRTARIVAVSAQVRDVCIAKGLPSERMVVIPNGIQANGAPPPARQMGARQELLTQLGLPSDVRLIACAGPLTPHKRLKDVIWAAELLKVIRDDVYLLILGDGPQRRSLTRYRDQVQKETNVHFLGQRDDAAEIIAQCDLLWLASAYEGQPSAVMEALAAGVPVVATDIPGVRELVTRGQHGYLARVGDRAALARYANKLIDDPELRARLGAAGRERMEREFSVEGMVARYTALYRDELR